MSDMISAKIENKIVVTPFAKIDRSLVGVPGDTITVPQYAYIGDAEDVAEGASATTCKLTASTTQVKIKKAMKAVSITDESVLSGLGNPVGEATSQLSKAMASHIDADAISALLTATVLLHRFPTTASSTQSMNSMRKSTAKRSCSSIRSSSPSYAKTAIFSARISTVRRTLSWSLGRSA
ncbi:MULTISPECIES: N4-gp56 family major capsid protein [Caproicibacterium]|nr:N4-gp56 family major capsid protein [Caproicibacterium lactatifermentans]